MTALLRWAIIVLVFFTGTTIAAAFNLGMRWAVLLGMLSGICTVWAYRLTEDWK